MNCDNECYVVYDKYGGGSHSFRNPVTAEYTINQLFETKVDDPKAKYYTGITAVNMYNEKFGADSNFKIPVDLDFNIITPHMFQFHDEHNCEIVIVVISFETNKLVEYYTTHKTVPNFDFVINACRFHINYEKTIVIDDLSVDTVVDSITKTVIIPKSDIMDPIIENPSFMKEGKRLYDYQRRTIDWMYKTETRPKKIHYGANFNYELNLGPLVFDVITKEFVLEDKRGYIDFRGGALIDEVGLGKTIQMLTLCLLNPMPAKDMTYIDTENNMLKARGTLIICPNQLCGQWSREITNMISRPDLKIVNMLTKNDFDKYTYLDLINADFVIVSYNFIGNNCFTEKYTTKISKLKTYHKSNIWNHDTVMGVLKDMSKELVEDPTSLFKHEPLFILLYWYRIIIDEFHEPFTVPKYISVKHIIPLLKGRFKWSVTGTPFDKGIDSLYNMFDFSTDYGNKIGNNIILINDIKEHMMNNFFRRNTKQSVEDEFKLPELKEKVIWMKMVHTERMMYQAYLADPNVDKYSEIIRQLCCHPGIADEIKGAINNCKTLDDIERMMVSHYKKQYEIALRNVTRCEKYIAKTERRILVTEYKRQRRFLRQKGYRVEIELAPFEYDEDANINTVQVENDEVDIEVEDIAGDNNDLNIDDLIDDEDDTKPTKIINEENQKEILKLIKNELSANPSQTVANYKEILRQQNERLVNLRRISDGKKSSCTFFNNMLERIKKYTEKSKAKYELLMEKDRKKLELGDEYESDSDDDDDDDDFGNEEDSCGICMSEISGENVGVTKCGHLFCYECLKTSIADSAKCPMCQTPQNNKDVMMISFERPVFTKHNTEILKNKLELIEQVGTKLTNLIYYLNSIQDHVIIFSQWDSLLRKVGDVLSDHGISNVFCRGNVWTRDKAIREFNSDDKIKVIMLSSESAASGTNLTKASKVILLDPISGNYEYRRNMEWQAIGRAYRLGQKKPVEVVRFIVRDTVEEDIYRDNKSEDAKQNTQLNISEITDETITLSDDKLMSITEAMKLAKERKAQRDKERKERAAKRAVQKETKKVTTVVKKGNKPVDNKGGIIRNNVQ